MHALFTICLAISIVCFFGAAISAFLDGREERLRNRYEQQLTRLEEQAELCRAEIVVIQALAARDQVLARIRYLRSLSKRERGLLEARLRASAEAETRALYQLNHLEAENLRLTQQLTALTWDGRQ